MKRPHRIAKNACCLLIVVLSTYYLLGQGNRPILVINQQIDSGEYYIYKDLQKSEQFYAIAKESAENIGGDSLLAKIYVGLGIIERLKGNYPATLEYYQQALAIHQQLNDIVSISADYHNIGVVFRFTEYFDKAKDYLLKSVQLRTQLKDSLQLGFSYVQLGIVYRNLEQFDSTAYYYKEAHQLFEALNNQDQIISVKGSWAALEYHRGNYESSIQLNLEGIAYLKTQTNAKKSSLPTRYYNLARNYEKLEDYAKAISYLDQAIVVAQEERYLESLSKYYRFRSRLYAKQEDYKIALTDYKQYKRYRDTVYDVEKIKDFTEQRVSLEYEQQQLADSLQFVATQEKLELLAQSERTKKNFYLLAFILLSIIGIAVWYWLKNKRKVTEIALEKQQLESELLEERLTNTEKEAERIVTENQYRLEQKKNLLQHLEQLTSLTKDYKVIKGLNALAHDMNLQLNEDEQRLFFEEHRDQFNITFEEKLIELYPALTKSEREMCQLIRMNKSIKEVMELKGVSSASIRSKRSRIRKKVGLSREQELTQFLRQLGT